MEEGIEAQEGQEITLGTGQAEIKAREGDALTVVEMT
jgi:hypothetical protein